MKTKLIIATLLSLFLTPCQSGYRKEGGVWVWVSYDESVGKRVRMVDQHDPRSFKVLKNRDFAIDKNAAFYVGRLIQGADPATFEVIQKTGYSKDKKHVYIDDQIVVFADPSTFRVLEFPYAKDKKRVYCGNIPLIISEIEANQFKVTNTDDLMSASKSTILFSHFIEMNPDYKWLDTTGINRIIVGAWGTGETGNKKFKGFREVN